MAQRGSCPGGNSAVPFNPFEKFRWRERRAWRASAKRVQRDHEADQLALLRDLAAGGNRVTDVTGLGSDPLSSDGRALSHGRARPEDHVLSDGRVLSDAGPAALTAPAEMVIAGRRLRAGRIPRRSLAALSQAVASIASVPLTAVGRYGPYWVLTFRLATEQLVVLVDHLTVLPEWSGPGGRGLPTGPRVNVGV